MPGHAALAVGTKWPQLARPSIICSFRKRSHRRESPTPRAPNNGPTWSLISKVEGEQNCVQQERHTKPCRSAASHDFQHLTMARGHTHTPSDRDEAAHPRAFSWSGAGPRRPCPQKSTTTGC